jgi:hypothetical protein
MIDIQYCTATNKEDRGTTENVPCDRLTGCYWSVMEVLRADVDRMLLPLG